MTNRPPLLTGAKVLLVSSRSQAITNYKFGVCASWNSLLRFLRQLPCIEALGERTATTEDAWQDRKGSHLGTDVYGATCGHLRGVL